MGDTMYYSLILAKPRNVHKVDAITWVSQLNTLSSTHIIIIAQKLYMAKQDSTFSDIYAVGVVLVKMIDYHCFRALPITQ